MYMYIPMVIEKLQGGVDCHDREAGKKKNSAISMVRLCIMCCHVR